MAHLPWHLDLKPRYPDLMPPRTRTEEGLKFGLVGNDVIQQVGKGEVIIPKASGRDNPWRVEPESPCSSSIMPVHLFGQEVRMGVGVKAFRLWAQ